MSTKSPSHAELAKFVPNHVFRDQDFMEDFSVVHQESLSDKLGHNGTPAGPGFNRIPDVGVLLLHNLTQKLFVVEGSFF